MKTQVKNLERLRATPVIIDGKPLRDYRTRYFNVYTQRGRVVAAHVAESDAKEIVRCVNECNG